MVRVIHFILSNGRRSFKREAEVNLTKIIQIVQHVLAKTGFRLNYTKLIKLLYLSDRESLKLWDSAITKDSYASLKQGPVLSGLYNLIKGDYRDRADQAQWNAFFMRDGYDLIAIHKSEFPKDELSPREMEIIDSIEKKYRGWDYGKLIDLLHDGSRFPEWKDPGESSQPLSLEDILRALGRTEEQIKSLMEEEESFRREEELLSECQN